jgi:hypothetical protein
MATNHDRKSFGSQQNSKSYSYDWHCWHFLSAFRHFGTHWVEGYHMSKSSGMMDPTHSCEMPSFWAIDIFTSHSGHLSVSHAQKMEQLRELGAWHHNWKLWGQNHNIYSHYMSTTIYPLRREVLWHCLWNSIVTFTPSNSVLSGTFQNTALYKVRLIFWGMLWCISSQFFRSGACLLLYTCDVSTEISPRV